jgi:hypothetical protein
MDGKGKARWEEEIEEILREQFQGNQLSERMQKAKELLEITQEVELPVGDIGQIVAILLRQMSEELRPLTAAYAGYQLGVAFERYNGRREDAR